MSLQAGREWTVYERDPEVEPHARRIRCSYDFVAASGERATQARPARDRAPGRGEGGRPAWEARFKASSRGAERSR